MKILYIAGIESIHTQRWVKYFADRQYEVHLITNMPPNAFPITNVKQYKLKRFLPDIKLLSYILSFIINVFYIMNLIWRIKPDAIHAHYIIPFGLWGALSRYHPLVMTTWGSDVLIDPYKNLMFKMLTRYALSKADSVTCDADHVVRAIQKLKTDPGKIELIYFGTDTKRFSPDRRSNALRERLGLNDTPLIISVRNLAPIYDIGTLIRAVPLILSKVPDAKFVIAGRGPEEDSLRELVSYLGVSDHVFFIGYISQDDLPAYLASSDIYVSTALSDAGLAASTAEAMAAGLPVVITDFGDNRKWVTDGVNGFLVPLGDPDAVAKKIVYLLESKNDRMVFGQANRKVIEERNSYHREMSKVEELYQKLVDKYKNTRK